MAKKWFSASFPHEMDAPDPSIHLSIHPSIHPSVRPYIHPSIYPSTHSSSLLDFNIAVMIWCDGKTTP